MNTLCSILDPYLSCDACGVSVCKDPSCKGPEWIFHYEHPDYADDLSVYICPTTRKIVKAIRPHNNEWLRFILWPTTASAV